MKHSGMGIIGLCGACLLFLAPSTGFSQSRPPNQVDGQPSFVEPAPGTDLPLAPPPPPVSVSENAPGGDMGQEVAPEEDVSEVETVIPSEPYSLLEPAEFSLTPSPWLIRTVLPHGQSFSRSYETWFQADPLEVEGSLSQKDLGDYGEISVVLHPAVEQNIRYFQTVIPERFQQWLTRFSRYQPLVREIFQEFGLPEDLMYLSLIESGFNPRAYSRARAAGPWQFMKATGRMYNLRVNWYVDERRDPIKSTVAAAQHLRDLYDRFGSWPLALAAYNAGSGKISRAIRRSGSRDYWKIRRTRYIRRETKNYVPRYMAAQIIATNPSLYGFDVNPSADVHEFDEVHVTKSLHLRTVAKEADLSYDHLRELNPELRRSVTPPEDEGYFLKVPAGEGPRVAQIHDGLQEWVQAPPTSPTWYRVRRGDSLSVIASRFGVTVDTLKRENRLSGHLIRVGDRLRISPTREYGTSQWYRVRSGDSLSVIAKRHRMSVRELKRLNRLSGHMIHVGDRLKVRGVPVDNAGNSKSRWYRVRRGDSLWTISRRFGVSVRDLIDLNRLPGTMIHAGLRLLVSP